MNFPSLELRPLRIPDDLTAPDAADFIEMTRVRNLVYREINGDGDDDLRPDELLPHYRPAPDEVRFVWVALWGGRIVGRAGLDIPLEDGSRSAYWLIELLRDAHGNGIGRAAYDLIEQTARSHGRTALQAYVSHPEAPGARLAAPTGFGTVPDDRAARFLTLNGYALMQVERKSVLDLAASRSSIEALLADAQRAASEYRVVQWAAPTPDEHLTGYAWMKSRMSTDAPAAGLDVDEERWDDDRVRRHDERYVAAGQTLFVTAAQHIGTGELAAFTELMIGSDRALATHQEDTLVLREHRGHRLGALVKCAALMAWRELAPASPRVITYNAEENRPMLSINEAMGFVPVAYEGGWKKTLD